MKLRFKDPNERAPKDILAEASLVFEEGPLAGLSLVGFTIWRGKDDSKGKYWVSLPAKQAQKGYFDFLRSTDGDIKDVYAFKDKVLEKFEAWYKGASGGEDRREERASRPEPRRERKEERELGDDSW